MITVIESGRKEAETLAKLLQTPMKDPLAYEDRGSDLFT